MNGAAQKASIFAGLIVAIYAIYTISNPQTDGYVFATVIAVVTGIGGYVVGALKMSEKS